MFLQQAVETEKSEAQRRALQMVEGVAPETPLGNLFPLFDPFQEKLEEEQWNEESTGMENSEHTLSGAEEAKIGEFSKDSPSSTQDEEQS
jgi:hypothetical protein